MQSKAKQSKAMQSNAMQCNAKQSMAKHSKAKQCNAKQSKAKHGKAQHSIAEEKNPNWFNTESGQDTYNSMVAEITAGVANTREKIKKLISSQVKLPVPENKKIT